MLYKFSTVAIFGVGLCGCEVSVGEFEFEFECGCLGRSKVDSFKWEMRLGCLCLFCCG